MENQKIPLDQLRASISRALKQYGDNVSENVAEVAEKFARRGAKALREQSAEMNFKGSGEYAKGWTFQVDKHRLWTDVVIYNRTPGLPHLLEHGHLLRNGRRWVPPKQHIEPIEAELIEQFEKEVLAKL